MKRGLGSRLKGGTWVPVVSDWVVRLDGVDDLKLDDPELERESSLLAADV